MQKITVSQMTTELKYQGWVISNRSGISWVVKNSANQTVAFNESKTKAIRAAYAVFQASLVVSE